MGGKQVKGNETKNSSSRSWRADFVTSALLGGGLLVLVKAGVCECTLFSLTSMLMVMFATLAVGNQAFGALTMEREKKTLDCLRLTQWNAAQVLGFKLRPELLTLAQILLIFAPSVLLLGALGDAGVVRALGVVALATLGGVASAVFGIFISSINDTTSQAYVAGRCGKAVWLLLTPILDRLAAAVLVTQKSVPLFSSLNPWVATWRATLPESATGADAAVPVLALVLLPLVTLAMWKVACHRFETGMVAAPSLTDRHVHPVYRSNAHWPQALRSNPSLLRELAQQTRAGAGRWPGYAVFFVLFLAPFLYAQSWAMKANLERNESLSHRSVRVEGPSQPVNLPADHQGGPVAVHSQGITLRSRYDYNTRYILKDHHAGACLRTLGYQMWGIPLPASQMVKVVEQVACKPYEPSTGHSTPTGQETKLSSDDAKMIGAVGVEAPVAPAQTSEQRRYQLSLAALGMGLSGGITLLLIYLGIRCSGFLAAAVTGEKERSTWNDLILSGMSPTDLLVGKLGGALVMPMLQMSVAFPSLALFIFAGALSVPGAFALYFYTLAVALTFALFGLWSSARSTTSHESHTRALFAVLMVFGVGTLASVSGSFAAVLTGVAALLVVGGGRATGRAWFAAGLAVAASLLCPQVISPLSATKGFLALPMEGRRFAPAAPPLFVWVLGMLYIYSWAVMLWETLLASLSHRHDSQVLENDRAA